MLMYVHMSVGARGDQKGASDPLQLELYMLWALWHEYQELNSNPLQE